MTRHRRTIEQILARADKSGPPVYADQPCWIHAGSVNASGYGTDGARLVHRMAWESGHGPIESGFQVHHCCRNKACCNPAHLKAMSNRDHQRYYHTPFLKDLKEHRLAQLRAVIEAVA